MKNHYHFDIIAKTIHYIKDHQNEQPSLEEIANHVHLSKYHFQRLFKKWAGLSPKDYLQFITLEKAKEALRCGQSTLEASYQVGLSGNSRLHDLFVKIESCTPGEFQKGGKHLKIQFAEIETPFGNAMLCETDKGVSSLSFDTFNIAAQKADYPHAIFENKLGRYGELVQAYFKNWKIPTSIISLDLKGTPFQIQVWRALLQIPSSYLLSYKDIAHKINNPKAVRAVGTAIGKNPIGYLIPCHRVIKGSGQMGNYRWKPERKIAMNSYESIRLRT